MIPWLQDFHFLKALYPDIDWARPEMIGVGVVWAFLSGWYVALGFGSLYNLFVARAPVGAATSGDWAVSMSPILLSSLPRTDDTVEVVERKGVGHPDTICDALAETLSRALSQAYLARFGEVLHHNVDKALLCAGRASPAFGGGRVNAPMDIYLAGRAVAQVGRDRLPIREIAVESARAWLRTHLHALDVDRHVRLHPVLRPGSQDLRSLFRRTGQSAGPLANDTSIGVGYAPLSPLEALVLAVENAINPPQSSARPPAWGEDVKVMGARIGRDVDLTISSAMIGAHLGDLDHYLEAKSPSKRWPARPQGRVGSPPVASR